MDRQEFDSLEIEANASPHISSHHVHIPRGYSSAKLLRIVEKEALDQLESWQNLWVFPYPFDENPPKID